MYLEARICSFYKIDLDKTLEAFFLVLRFFLNIKPVIHILD